jgi:hypothetical protein
MNLKSSLLALAAVVALGTTALTSTSAEAHGKFGGGKGFHGGGMKFHGGGKHFHGGHKHWGHKPHFHGHVHWHRRHWKPRHIYYYPRPVVYAARPVVYSSAPVVTPNRCTCLTKEYTQEGAVLFKDICTNEAAINPPPAPVQTGYAPQPQSATGAPVAQ